MAACGLALVASVASLLAQSTPGVISGPVGPSPYDIVRGWHKPFSELGARLHVRRQLGPLRGIAQPPLRPATR
jgi:hypothetical protein